MPGIDGTKAATAGTLLLRSRGSRCSHPLMTRGMRALESPFKVTLQPRTEAAREAGAGGLGKARSLRPEMGHPRAEGAIPGKGKDVGIGPLCTAGQEPRLQAGLAGREAVKGVDPGVRGAAEGAEGACNLTEVAEELLRG